MRALKLTLYRPFGLAELLPWLLLGALLLAGFGLGQRYLEQAQQTTRLQRQIERARRLTQPVAPAPPSPEQRKQYDKLQKLVADLNQWPLDALDSLAAIRQPPAAILAVEQNGDATQLTVETKDLTTLFEYWLQLQAAPQVARVSLLQHSQHAQPNYSTARGVFRVQWRGRP